MTVSSRLSKVERVTAALIQQIRLAPAVPTFWLPISYVMAHVQIESGFDPQVLASDYDTTGSVGLMQPEAATATEIFQQYAREIKDSGLPVVADMKDPLSNLVVGMLYLYTCHQYLLPIFNDPLAYCHIAVAYNAGPGASARMSYNQAVGYIYYIDWASAQRGFGFLDQPPPRISTAVIP